MINKTELLEFKEMYRDFFNSITGKYDKDEISTFFMQIGKNYHNSALKCLFIGKATNGWVSKTYDVEELFDLNNEDRIINRNDEIEWVEKQWGINQEGIYNTKKSPFWRVIKNVSLKILSPNDWYENIAWTNIYKFAPGIGNPNAKLQNLQRKNCIEIMDKEIEYLKPDVIIFLTSNWEWFYFNHIKLKMEKYYEWDGNKTYFKEYNDILYISSMHPQSKPENNHIEVIERIIKEHQ